MLDLIQRFNVRFKVRFMLGISVRIYSATVTLVKTAVEVGDKSMLKFYLGGQMFGINLNYSTQRTVLLISWYTVFIYNILRSTNCTKLSHASLQWRFHHCISFIFRGALCTSMPQINHSKLLEWCCVLTTASQWFSTLFL